MTIEIVDFPIKNGDFPVRYFDITRGYYNVRCLVSFLSFLGSNISVPKQRQSESNPLCHGKFLPNSRDIFNLLPSASQTNIFRVSSNFSHIFLGICNISRNPACSYLFFPMISRISLLAITPFSYGFCRPQCWKHPRITCLAFGARSAGFLDVFFVREATLW